MNDPWQILILDANTATERDVKAAYARLLKQHRPDADPEGFRRVREAYEVAIATIRDRDAQGTPPPAYAQMSREGDAEQAAAQAVPESIPLTVELPETVQPSYSEVERAVASGNAEQLEAALQAFHGQCESARVDPTMRDTALEHACAGQVKLLATAIPDKMLLRFAELGRANLPHTILSVWLEEERRDRIVEFGRAMLEHARSLATPDGALLMARVGVMVGLELPRMASSLGNLAFPHLPVDARTQILGQLEQEAALGQVFEEVTPAMKPFWFERLRHASETHDWSDTHSVRALDDLIHRNRYVWQGWGIIQQLLPEDRWAKVEGRLRDQATIAAQSAPPKTKFPLWLVAIPVVLVLNLLRTISDTPRSPSLPQAGPYTRSVRFTEPPSSSFSTDAKLRKAAESWNLPKQASNPINTPNTVPSLMDLPKLQPLMPVDPLLPKLPQLGTPNLSPLGTPSLPSGPKGSNSEHLRGLLNNTSAPRTN
jgi:hypothetical protein